jgi:two-component sensor histidine kinase
LFPTPPSGYIASFFDAGPFILTKGTYDRLTDLAAPTPSIAALQAEILRLEGLLETQAGQARLEQDRLTFELGHRVKNTLGVVQALASQTLRRATSPQDAIDTLNHRILALARANDAILREGWSTASIGGVARRVLQGEGTGYGALQIMGAEVRITASAALSFAMALHELATNARRHGAWSSQRGRIVLSWEVEAAPAGARLVLTWREHGGPPAEAPDKRGFGLRLIEQSLKSGFGRDVTITFAPPGVCCRVQASLDDLQPPP